MLLICYLVLGNIYITSICLANCPGDGLGTAKEVDVNVTWVRLEQIRPNSSYVACVRAITQDATKTERIGDWSFVQIFETQQSGRLSI